MENNTKNGITINHIMRQLLTASKQQLLKQQLEHTFIPNASPKQKTATSTLKHELLYYLSTSSIYSNYNNN